MRNDPSVNVTIEAFVGYKLTSGLGLLPTGRGPNVYNRTNFMTINGVSAIYSVGQMMDARARAVSSLLIGQGIDSSRIKLSRDGAYYGSASRKVEFYFNRN